MYRNMGEHYWIIGINNHICFLKADDDDELFIMGDVHENTSFFLEDN